MATQSLFGSYSLDRAGIDRAIRRISAGAYALGTDSQDGKMFLVRFVGRSGYDVRKRLKEHIGAYQRFMYRFCATPKDAFETECILYHDFGELKLDNAIHPARPDGSIWQCPRCKIFG
jgi:hypothetical protein